MKHQGTLIEARGALEAACKTLELGPERSTCVQALAKLNALIGDPLLECDPIYLEQGTGPQSRLTYAMILRDATRPEPQEGE